MKEERINKLKSVWFTRYSHPTLFHKIEFALLFIYHKCNYCSLLRFISTFWILCIKNIYALFASQVEIANGDFGFVRCRHFIALFGSTLTLILLLVHLIWNCSVADCNGIHGVHSHSLPFHSFIHPFGHRSVTMSRITFIILC